MGSRVGKSVVVSVLVVASWVFASVAGAGVEPGEGGDRGVLRRREGVSAVFDVAEAEVADRGVARLLVTLDDDVRPSGDLVPVGAARRGSVVAERRAELAAELRGTGSRLGHSFEFVPVVAVTVDADGLERLRGSEAVRSVIVDEPRRVPLVEEAPRAALVAQSVPQIRADVVNGQGGTGEGQVIVMVDSGVDSSHLMLAGAVVGEACYSSTSVSHGSTSLCPGGVESATDGGDPCPAEVYGCDHGTHVAGIAAGRAVSNGAETLSGVAPGASIYSIQVYSRFTGSSACGSHSPCALSFISDELQALERVYEIRDSYDIAAVNLSLGGGGYTSECASEPEAAIIASLRQAGILTVVAAGNDGWVNAVSSPACVPSAVSVSSVGYSSGGVFYPDEVSIFANTYRWLDFLAPGLAITSAVPGGGYATYSGTSLSAPHVAGAFALLGAAAPNANIETLYDAMSAGAVSVWDPWSERSYKRIDVASAFDLVASPEPLGVAALASLPVVLRAQSHSWSWASYGGRAPYTYDVRRLVVGARGRTEGWKSYLSGVAATSLQAPSGTGATICYSVRTHDGLGAVSSWSTRVCTTVPVDDRSLSRSGGWDKIDENRFFRGTASRTTRDGSTLTIRDVQAEQVYLVATRCPKCGRVVVYWNGMRLGSVSLASSTTKHQAIVPLRFLGFGDIRTGDLRLEADVTSGKVVQIDGVALLRH